MTGQTVRISGTNYGTLLTGVSPVSCSLFSSHVDDATLRQSATIMEVLMAKQEVIEFTVEMYLHGILGCFTFMAQLFWCEPLIPRDTLINNNGVLMIVLPALLLWGV